MNQRFLHIINSTKPVLVDFYTDWCGPCKEVPAILKEVKQDFKGHVRIVKVNVDRNPYIASRYKISSVPTLMVFKKGTLLWKTEGVCNADELKSVVRKQIQEEN